MRISPTKGQSIYTDRILEIAGGDGVMRRHDCLLEVGEDCGFHVRLEAVGRRPGSTVPVKYATHLYKCAVTESKIKGLVFLAPLGIVQ